MSSSPTPPKVSLWVKAFVYFHLAAITIWSLPMPRPEVLSGQTEPWGNEKLILFNSRYLQEGPVKYYVQPIGLWQYWDLFAPEPLKRDIYMDAILTRQNGDKEVVKYPRIAEMGLLQKYQSERYRKFFERINGANLESLFSPVALRIAVSAPVLAGNPVTRIDLIRQWMDVAPPGQPASSTYKSEVIYTRYVSPAELKGTGDAR